MSAGPSGLVVIHKSIWQARRADTIPCRCRQAPELDSPSRGSHERSAAKPPIARGKEVKKCNHPVVDTTGKGCADPSGLKTADVRLVYDNGPTLRTTACYQSQPDGLGPTLNEP